MPKPRIYKSFESLSEDKKDEILKWILDHQSTILNASIHFNLPRETINKIFEQRYMPKKEKLNNN